jgi:hypothetical protein
MMDTTKLSEHDKFEREIDGNPEAWDAGYDYGMKYGLRPSADAPKFAEGYTGAYIEGEPGSVDKAGAYSAYCAGYGSGCRARTREG